MTHMLSHSMSHSIYDLLILITTNLLTFVNYTDRTYCEGIFLECTGVIIITSTLLSWELQY